jgi:hypothetical protein
MRFILLPVMSRSARIGKKNVPMLLIERKLQMRLVEGVWNITNRVSQHIVVELLVPPELESGKRAVALW